VDRGPRQLTKILETLSVVRAGSGMAFETLLTSEGDHLPRGATIIAITPSTREGWLAAAQRLLRRGLRVIAVLIDAESFGGRPGVRQAAARLAMVGIPTYVIHLGDDLSVALGRSN
jgi:hypothetical protein